MRGSPITQALILLCTLLTLGFLGKIYLRGNHPSGTPAATTAPDTTSAALPSDQHDLVEAEIQLTFSSPPISYELKRLSPDNSSEISVLKQSPPTENPSYEDTHLPSHQVATYLLDIIWEHAPETGSRHFAQINISPAYGQQASLSFTTHSKDMLETFEYSVSTHNSNPNHDHHE